MTRTTVDRSKVVAALAPPAPACFSSRGQWTEFLIAAAADQRPGRAPGPLLIEPGKPVFFNTKFDFCRECTDRHMGAMAAQGKCKPLHLVIWAAQFNKKVPA